MYSKIRVACTQNIAVAASPAQTDTDILLIAVDAGCHDAIPQGQTRRPTWRELRYVGLSLDLQLTGSVKRASGKD